MIHRTATMERAEIGRISRDGFTDDPGGPSVLVLVERRCTRKQARTAAGATDNTRYRSAGGAICRPIRVIRWFGDFPSGGFANATALLATNPSECYAPQSLSGLRAGCKLGLGREASLETRSR